MGFALGELSDDELRELYDALREPGERGLRASRLTWQQLGVVTDLRAHLGASFQDIVRHRIARDGLSDRFVRDSRARLGLPGHALPEIGAPSVAAAWRWRTAALIAAALIALVVAAALLHGGRASVCRVGELAGTASLGGEPLVPGAALDASHQVVVVPSGSMIALEWSGDAKVQVRISGPANAIALEDGCSLLNGEAWVAGSGSFQLGLPDRSVRCALPGGQRFQLAASVADGASVVAAGSNGVNANGETLGANTAIAGTAGSATVFPWMDADLSSLPPRTACVPDWTLEARARWKDADASVVARVEDEGGAHGWEAHWRPGALVLHPLAGGGADRTLAIAGAPLADGALTLVASRGHLRIWCGGEQLGEAPIAASTRLVLGGDARTAIRGLRFWTGPRSTPVAAGP